MDFQVRTTAVNPWVPKVEPPPSLESAKHDRRYLKSWMWPMSFLRSGFEEKQTAWFYPIIAERENVTMRRLFLKLAERAEDGKRMSPGSMHSRVGFQLDLRERRGSAFALFSKLRILGILQPLRDKRSA